MKNASSPRATAYALDQLLDACRKGDTVLAWQLLLSPTRAVSVDAVGAEGETPLIAAAKHGHPRLVNSLLELGANVDARDVNGQTALYFVAYHSRVGMAAVLLQHHASVDARDVAGWTPLCIAAYSGHEHIVSLLLKHRADVNTETVNTVTPLYLAAQNNQVGVVAMLLIHQAKIDVADQSGVTSLFIAAQNGHILVLSVLLACGASVDAVNKNGVSPLQIAAQNGRANMVAELLKHHANVDLADRDGVTPLYFAAQNGHADVVSLLLLKHPATDSLRAVAVNGWTPLHVAACQCHVKVVSTLLPHRVNVNAAELVGDTSLHLAAERDHSDVVSLLLKKHANVNAANAKGDTPLHGAAFQGHAKVLRLLLKHHANVDAVNVLGATPLYIAAQNGRMDMMSSLIEHCANVNTALASGPTPLFTAANLGHLAVVTLLLKHQADVDTANANGATPLCIATHEGHVVIVTLLLKHQANVNAATLDGRNPLHIAVENHRVGVLRELLKHRAANLHAASLYGWTPLYTAAAHGYADMVSLLLEYQAKVKDSTASGWTPLHVAAWRGHRDVVVVLLSYQASTDAVEEEGLTPLHFAAAQGHDAVMAVLPEHMTNVDVSSVNGRAPLHMAAAAGHVDVMVTLMARGANVDAVTVDGSTPLHIAAQSDRTEVVTLLASSGRSMLEVADAQGSTPIIVAARSGHFDLVKFLMSVGASVHVRAADGETVLVSAARWRNMSTITLLFDLGHLSPKSTTDGQGSLLSASIQTLKEYQEHTFEFQQMWARVVDRVMNIYGQLAESSGPIQDSNYQLIMVVFHFARLRKVCSSRNVFVRLVASDAIANRFRDLHIDLSVLGQDLNLSSFDSTHADWEAQCSKDELALLEMLREKVEGAESKELSQESKETQVEVASLLQHKVRVHGDKCSSDLLDLLELSLRKVQEASNVVLPTVPDWFIPPHDLDDDQVGEGSGDKTNTTPVRTMWANSTVMVSQHRVTRFKFVETVEKCRSMSHPNVVKVFGASHLQSPYMAVFENALSTSLREYLSRQENKHMLWQKLHEVSLGLNYLIECGIAVENLRCDDIWVGTDGIARINALGCVAVANVSTEDAKWQAPEVTRGEAPTVASNVYSLGMCMLELITGTTSWKDRENKVFTSSMAQLGWRPQLPEGLTKTQTDLLERMWLADPSKRPTLLMMIQQLAREQKSEHSSHGKPKTAKTRPYDIQRFVFSDLEYTIQGFLDKLEWKSSNSKSKEAVQHILRRARDVYELLQTQHRLQSDVIVTNYCGVLVSLNKFLRNTSNEKSVLRRAKSQKVALQSNVFHRKLDDLLTLLAPATTNPVHVWTQQPTTPEAIIEMDSSGEQCKTIGTTQRASGAAAATATRQEAVRIELFDSERPNIRFKAISAQTRPEHAPLLPSRRIDVHELKYDSSGAIGTGAFGEVYKATWNGTPVVIKFMGYEADGDAYINKLFFHELRVWEPLNHPHVVKLYGACEVGKRFFACEYMGNGTLAEYVKRAENAGKTWHLLYQVALGLQYLYDLNILHNDLKCDNVLIGADSKAKIIDFGLSSILKSAEVYVNLEKQGAQQWKSPEYLRVPKKSEKLSVKVARVRLTLASDIYSFGMLILEATTGDSPWGDLIDAAVRFQVRKGNLPEQPGCMSGLQWSLIQMMCASNPSHRVKIAHVVDKLHEYWQQQELQQQAEQKKPEIATDPSDAP